MSSPTTTRRWPPVRHRRGVVVLAATALLGGLTVACTPTPAPFDPRLLPPDINLMTDGQVVDGLGAVAADVAKAYADPRTRAAIPPDQVAAVDQLVAQLGTADGRAALIPQFRQAALEMRHGLPRRPEAVDLGGLGLSTGDRLTTDNDVPASGTRSGPPSGTGTVTTDGVPIGATVAVGAPSSAACGAPDGAGAVAAPEGVSAGQLLTPQHDVFTRTSSGIAIGQAGDLSPTGVDPVAGGGPGIELRSGRFTQQMHVRIDLEDPKHFGPAALYPLINIRPIGAGPAEEFRATITDGHIYCYAGDTRTDRGYFDGWVTIPRSEPGFQVIDEVVENNWFFRCSLDNLQHCDLALQGAEPAYWAGADRATVHAGAPAVSTAATLASSVGAFATGVPDGGGGPGVLTDNNDNGGDDLEAAIKGVLDSEIRSKVAGTLAGDLFDIGVVTLQASLTKPLDNTIDLRFTTPQDGFAITSEPPGATGAIHADAHVHADTLLSASLLGLECDNLTTKVDVDLHANAWADSAGLSTGITPLLASNTNSNVDIDMPLVMWANPVCVIVRGLSALEIGEHFIEGGVNDGLNSAFGSVKLVCLLDRSIFNLDGSLVHPENGIPQACHEPGSVEKLLAGFDLGNYLPTLSLGSTTLKPVVANLDNSWCHAAGAPAGCSPDQDLIGNNGVGVVADATMVSSLGQALGGGFEGRFRNVFAPSTSSTIADLATAKRDLNQQVAGLGVLVDPRLVNMTLRDLAQGDSTTRATTGLLDVSDYALPLDGWTLSTHPEVAPEVLGVPTPPPVLCDVGCAPSPYPAPTSRATAAVVVPDVRVGTVVGTGSGAPVQYSVAASVNAGAGYNPATGLPKPTLDTAQVDIQVTGGCKADYVGFYATSYLQCGRGRAGTGGPAAGGSPITLTSTIDYLVNNVVLPLVTKSIGGIGLPSLDALVPGLHVSLTNVRFNQRGGFLAVYAELKPTPRAGIAVSSDSTGGQTILRFFPTNLSGIDTNLPTTYTWEIRDATTGQVVPTQPYPGVDSAVVSSVDHFVPTPTNFGPGKVAAAKLTISQSGLQVTADTTFTWYPPSPPPNNPCAGGTPSGLRSLARVNVAAAPPGCH